MTFDTVPRLSYSVAEVAHSLGVSRPLVYRLIAEGQIPATELGRRLTVPAWWVDQALGVPRPTGGGGGPAVEPSAYSSP